MWVVFNEGWGQHDTERLTKWVKELDPSRLVNNASGWTDKKCGDVIDMHNYPGPGSPKPEAHRAAVLGEFGGLGLAVDGHTWSKKTWGYKGTQSLEDLTRNYEKLLAKAWVLKDKAGLSACIYTQLTDVETECNGLLTYDREVNKVIPERAAAVNTGKLPPPPVIKEVVPTSQRQGRQLALHARQTGRRLDQARLRRFGLEGRAGRIRHARARRAPSSAPSGRPTTSGCGGNSTGPATRSPSRSCWSITTRTSRSTSTACWRARPADSSPTTKRWP